MLSRDRRTPNQRRERARPWSREPCMSAKRREGELRSEIFFVTNRTTDGERQTRSANKPPDEFLRAVPGRLPEPRDCPLMHGKDSQASHITG